MILEDHQSLFEARGIRLRALDSFESFEAAHGFVNASVH
jgi:hypothetical protein